MSEEKTETFVGLDLGTTKICAIVAEVNGSGINILGMGTHPSTGLRRGIVVDMEKTTDCIVSAVEKAETMSGKEIRSVFAGIAGGHVKSQNAHGVVTITDGKVAGKDIERLIDSATARAVPADRELIHATPGKYSIDRQPPVVNPLGMHGKKIETDVHIVTGQVADTNNLVKCVRNAGMDVNGIVLEQIASGAAVLSEAEKDFGVVLVDCGGGTTDIAVFSEGRLQYTQNITLGGNHIDRDISHCFNTVTDLEARRVKEAHGVAIADMAADSKDIEVHVLTENSKRLVSQREIAEVIEPRMREIFLIVKDEIPDSVRCKNPTAKVILTGGSFIMKGSVEIASEIFDMPARVGVPFGVETYSDTVLTPAYSTGVGLIHYGVKYFQNSDKIRVRGENTFQRIRGWMEQWFNGYF